MPDDPAGDLSVPNGIDFNHPYTPYDVQTEFMKAAYGVLQSGNGQVGILESPTGTVRTIAGPQLWYGADYDIRANPFRLYAPH